MEKDEEREMEVDKREKISKWKMERDGGRVESSRERLIQSQLYKQRALIPVFTAQQVDCRGGGPAI